MRFILAGGNELSEWELMKTVVPEADELGFWCFVLPDHYMWTSKPGNKRPRLLDPPLLPRSKEFLGHPFGNSWADVRILLVCRIRYTYLPSLE